MNGEHPNTKEAPTTDQRNLPKLLRDAERRVNAHVFKTGGDDALASIPANLDRDVDMLLMEAATQLEAHYQYIEWASPQLERLGREIVANDRLRDALGNISRMKCHPDKFAMMTTLAAAIKIATDALAQEAGRE